jgi:hypothetical protein
MANIVLVSRGWEVSGPRLSNLMKAASPGKQQYQYERSYAIVDRITHNIINAWMKMKKIIIMFFLVLVHTCIKYI